MTVPNIAEAAQADLGGFECSSYSWQARHHLNAVSELESQVVRTQLFLPWRRKRHVMLESVVFQILGRPYFLVDKIEFQPYFV